MNAPGTATSLQTIPAPRRRMALPSLRLRPGWCPGCRWRRWRSSCWCCSPCRPSCSWRSASSITTASGIYPAFILDNYKELLTTPATCRVYLSSLKFAVIVWAITLFLGFNIAYFLVFHIRSATMRIVFFLLCAIPFWTSGIIRTIAWIPFLGRNGAFNQLLMDLHITSQPLEFLLFSDFAVIITYVHLFTLLMIGPIANSLARSTRH